MITAYELGCLTVKQAAELPWRERVEVYAKHPRTGKIYGGMWNTDKSFAVPGGGVDSGETPEQAAIRELAEETGIHATNPVRLPIDPVDNPWSDAYRAEKGRNFAGSRTHFVLADYLKKDKDKQLDKWEANNRKFYTPEQALALMQGKQFLAPDVAAARIKAIQHILQGMQKKAALNDEVKLQEHQQRIIDRMKAGDKRLLLYHGLGSGKSLSSIAAAEALGQPYAAVTPASLRQNYEKEIEKFTTGSKPDILSYTGIGMGKEPSNQPQTLIFDEAHRLRTPSTDSAQAARRLAEGNKNLLLLTGTPITNSPTDLASLISMLNNKPLSPEKFKEEFIGKRKVQPSLFGRFMGRTPGDEYFVRNEDKLRALLKGKVDYQPTKTPEGVNVNEQTIRAPISTAQQRIQTAIKSQIPPEWSWKLNKEFPLSAKELESLNAFMTGLRQSSLSTLPFRGDANPLTAFHESGKLQRAFSDLQQELQTDPRRKALVYSNFIEAGLSPYEAALAEKQIPYGVLHGGIPAAQRKKTLQDYNEGKIRTLLLGPAGAEGISTKGTNLIQLLDPHWHESRSSQAAGRGLRFDSHTDLPEELKNVAIRRYISTAPEQSMFAKLLGRSPERTGDEILETLARRKETLNEAFRRILREEGTPKQ